MSHLVFNSFPRSGNVFISNIAGQAFSMNISSVHMPEILKVPELYNVVVFRKPEDAIASMVNKTRNDGRLIDSAGHLNTERIAHVVEHSIGGYDEYLQQARLNLNMIQIVLFDNLIKNYEPVMKAISDKFSLPLNEGYETRINLDLSSPIWSHKYDGHSPRAADTVRLEIEDIVSSTNGVRELNDRYFDLINDL